MLQKQHNERKFAIIVAAKIVSAKGGTFRRQYKRRTLTGSRAILYGREIKLW
ncbi:hypothetical protein GGTG_04200 [Gaeumannomyces tritici R3-111a-1]|uniref:Uncharacterized protein n=1 Tax=Gaeumannomyces tritici (strain R3-111a-1) TaxID=644352 RepID=J3NSF0_GAET3|nr:hypothetical protein GGTG_04200 [Gaeumannomyces tritici R3-111a-1]EJT79111.1 hypothetical protein GGTG_04200 [Gaeumannomyces tritici R3-111a-1]